MATKSTSLSTGTQSRADSQPDSLVNSASLTCVFYRISLQKVWEISEVMKHRNHPAAAAAYECLAPWCFSQGCIAQRRQSELIKIFLRELFIKS